MPINDSYPLKNVLEAVRTYAQGDRSTGASPPPITIEYCLIDHVNDGVAEAEELCRILKGLPCLVNLIPFNPWPGSDFKTSSLERTDEFLRTLVRGRHESMRVTVRKSRGSDILAACGQLAVKNAMTTRIPDFKPPSQVPSEPRQGTAKCSSN